MRIFASLRNPVPRNLDFSTKVFLTKSFIRRYVVRRKNGRKFRQLLIESMKYVVPNIVTRATQFANQTDSQLKRLQLGISSEIGGLTVTMKILSNDAKLVRMSK